MCFIEKTYYLCLGMNYNAIGHELSVNKSTILDKMSLKQNKKHTRYIYLSVECDQRLTGT